MLSQTPVGNVPGVLNQALNNDKILPAKYGVEYVTR
jgi:hypothetical protein